ncbi:hypothetical protein XO10_03905 [Marinitoga sp. 1135]|uniref:Ribosome maturation factor RimM n=1 Tax=Marinitoga piezophila (strain DSM 14283 / JCM 11233 / KA3) TaxID=443254 RepID=H2J6U3_MARPK|nr:MULTISPECIES: ribosome maturation factor RimM [Marinitoga]AEX85208.1 16S rRNA processing protein RimM [Marinitoga piezophila KA3]APT75699.1 hypothetical protein LN42_04340 [Marinitoga sp. 1137]NUU95440.1 hypothetical protein [Marinitoga sp. 1135]NUU97367.1 hypothetical protein [Marinitoga sp. 1138]
MKRLEDLLKDRIAIGEISNTHGLDGRMKLFPLSNEESLFENLTDVLLYNPKTRKFLYAKITEIKKANKLYIIRIAGVENIASAQRYKDFVIYINKNELPELNDDEFYYFELLGKNVYYEDGEYIGKIKDILETGANEVLIIENQINKYEKDETLYPLLKENLISFNKEKDDITVKRLEWYEDDTEDRD